MDHYCPIKIKEEKICVVVIFFKSEKRQIQEGCMAQYIFQAENLGQSMRVVESLKTIDHLINVIESHELTPFESDLRVKIQLEANYEQILKTLAETKNSRTPLETIRPLV